MSANVELFSEIFRTPTEQGQALAQSLLQRNGYAVQSHKDYKYGAGTIPLLLVAHTDTVHRAPPATLCCDKAAGIVWAPDTGLGADDRAGVYAIARILQSGLRPHVLLTDGEERGGIGAEAAAFTLAPPDVRLMIQLDRANSNDAVYYSHRPSRSLRRYLRRHDYHTAIGSYSDIATLMPEWEIAGVNLSVGYYGQHSSGEYLQLAELERTIKAVSAMCARPPSHHYPYRSEISRFGSFRFAQGLTMRDSLNGATADDWQDGYVRDNETTRCAYCEELAVDCDEFGAPCCAQHWAWSDASK